MFKKPKPKPRTAKRKQRVVEASKCRFCREKTVAVDFKDIPTLQKLVTAQGKLFSRKRSGNCAMHQRSSSIALKRARFMALMPFVG
ncbi:MAG: 30S ribosomal protein S18 [Phycisphaerae bacterium]|nr:30S ribosomal protein S18 [Phycisphaerae bacterium]